METIDAALGPAIEASSSGDLEAMERALEQALRAAKKLPASALERLNDTWPSAMRERIRELTDSGQLRREEPELEFHWLGGRYAVVRLWADRFAVYQNVLEESKQVVELDRQVTADLIPDPGDGGIILRVQHPDWRFDLPVDAEALPDAQSFVTHVESLGASSRRQNSIGAPIVDDGTYYFDDLLEETGFPPSEENRMAIRRMVGDLLAIKGVQFIHSKDPDALDAFIAEHHWERHPIATLEEAAARAQRILDDLARWDANVIPYIQDQPDRVRRILLHGAQDGEGFLRGDRSKSLLSFWDES